MGSHFWDCALSVARRFVGLAVLAAIGMAATGCSHRVSRYPAISLPEDARLYFTNHWPRPHGVPPDSSGRHYVYDDTDDAVITVFDAGPDTRFGMGDMPALPRGHQYRIYYIPRGGGVASGPGEPGFTVQRARQLAGTLEWLDAARFARPWRDFTHTGREYRSDVVLLRQLLSMPYSMEEVLSLLKDTDPKVRVIGIAMVFNLKEASAVNEIAALLDDGEVAFSLPRERRHATQRGMPADEIERLRVMDVAGEVVAKSLEVAGQPTGIDRSHLGEVWKRYWRNRNERAGAADDFVVALFQVTQGGRVVEAASIPAVYRIAGELRRLALPERLLILHRLWWLMGCEHHDPSALYLTSRKELRELASQLSPALRRAVARKEPIADDPDLLTYMRDDPMGRDFRRLVE